MMSRIVSVLAGMLLAASVSANEFADDPEYRAFVDRMVLMHGFDRIRLNDILDRGKFLPGVIEAISKPAEKLPWYSYRKIFLTDQRVDGGIEFWEENAGLLDRAEREFGVPPEIVTAIIGVETLYGRHKGKIPILDSLLTLGFAYPRRADFFRGELEQYLLLTREQGVDPLGLRGSYAGAMGMPQFISSSYREYAIDFDGDGKRNLWDNRADVIGSVANYFVRHGWERGGKVTAPAQVDGRGYKILVEAGIQPKLDMENLHAVGASVDGLDAADCPCAFIELELEDGVEHWAAANNFYVITRYNHSELYAMAVWQLAQRILEKRGAQ